MLVSAAQNKSIHGTKANPPFTFGVSDEGDKSTEQNIPKVPTIGVACRCLV